MRTALNLAAVLCLAAIVCSSSHAQTYAVGADVFFLGKCEQDGVVFKEDGRPKDVLAILRKHNHNWVWLRIFHDPSLSSDKLPNDLDYTLALAKRSKRMGFHLLLDLHYSDTWADPGKQPTPAAWSNLSHEQLVEKVFSYTRHVVASFARKGVMPDMVQVGKEITYGMLWPDSRLPGNWDNFTDLVKAGISGVEAGRSPRSKPRIMIHIDRSGDLDAAVHFYDELAARKVSFDVIGLSYNPFWHGNIATMGNNLDKLALRYKHPIVIVEAASSWTPGAPAGKRLEFPESPQGQKEFLHAVDLAVRAIPGGLGQGVFWWEPAAEGDLRDAASSPMMAMYFP